MCAQPRATRGCDETARGVREATASESQHPDQLRLRTVAPEDMPQESASGETALRDSNGEMRDESVRAALSCMYSLASIRTCDGASDVGARGVFILSTVAGEAGTGERGTGGGARIAHIYTGHTMYTVLSVHEKWRGSLSGHSVSHMLRPSLQPGSTFMHSHRHSLNLSSFGHFLIFPDFALATREEKDARAARRPSASRSLCHRTYTDTCSG